MALREQYKDLQHYEANTQGRDFVVGDLHGCIDMLLEVMEMLGFDRKVDRMFSVGDLVDRGPKSKETAELVFESWFHCVRANHEQMMIEACVNKNWEQRRLWYSNGGQWAASYPEYEMEDLARALDRLPYIITVGEGEGRFNIVHAEIIVTGYDHEVGNYFRTQVTDEFIDKWKLSETDRDNLLWGRTIISNGVPFYPPPAHDLYHHPTLMSPTFVGHTPVREPARIQGQFYIDGGAVFAHRRPDSEENMLLIAEPAAKIMHKYVVMHKTVYPIPFAELQHMS